MSHLVQRIQELDGVGEVVGPLESVISKVCPSRVQPQDDDLRLRHAVLHDVEHLLKPACRAEQRVTSGLRTVLGPGPVQHSAALPLLRGSIVKGMRLALGYSATQRCLLSA